MDGLVNNAGIYGPMGSIEEVDWAEWVRAIEVNLFGTVLPCRGVLPSSQPRRYGKIMNLSGGGATAPLPRLSAYAASKAAVVRFTETLAEELQGTGIDVERHRARRARTHACSTRSWPRGRTRSGKDFYERCAEAARRGRRAARQGRRAGAFLASAESDGISGRLLSAVWDPGRTCRSRRADSPASDIYTLRRIVPEGSRPGLGENA